jgi:LPS sulfotransferase NodH
MMRVDPRALHPVGYPALFKTFLVERTLKAPSAFVLVDIKYNALRLLDGGMTERSPAAIRLTLERGGKFVHVKRRNKLRVYTSILVAQKTGKWREMEENSVAVKDKQVRVSPRLALESIESDLFLERQVAGWLESLDASTIAYEDMFAEDGRFSDEALDLASRLLKKRVIEEPAAQKNLKKQNPEPLAEVITNFDEVQQFFETTPHAWMVAE